MSSFKTISNAVLGRHTLLMPELVGPFLGTPTRGERYSYYSDAYSILSRAFVIAVGKRGEIDFSDLDTDVLSLLQARPSVGISVRNGLADTGVYLSGITSFSKLNQFIIQCCVAPCLRVHPASKEDATLSCFSYLLQTYRAIEYTPPRSKVRYRAIRNEHGRLQRVNPLPETGLTPWGCVQFITRYLDSLGASAQEIDTWLSQCQTDTHSDNQLIFKDLTD